MLRKTTTKVQGVMDLKLGNYNLLDKKLNLIGEMLILKTDEVMKHAKAKFNESVPPEEELGN